MPELALLRQEPDDDGTVEVPDTHVTHELTRNEDGDLEVVSLVMTR